MKQSRSGDTIRYRPAEVSTFMTWEDANLPGSIKSLITAAITLYTSSSVNAAKKHLEDHYVRYAVYESDVLMTFNRDGLRTVFMLLHKLCAKVDVAISRVGVAYSAKKVASTPAASSSADTINPVAPNNRIPRLPPSSTHSNPEDEQAVVEYEGSLTWHLTDRWLASPVRWLLGKDTIVTRFSTELTIDMSSGKVLSQRDRAIGLDRVPSLPRLVKIALGTPAPLISTFIGV